MRSNFCRCCKDAQDGQAHAVLLASSQGPREAKKIGNMMIVKKLVFFYGIVINGNYP